MEKVDDLASSAFGKGVQEIESPLFTTVNGEERGVRVVLDPTVAVSAIERTGFLWTSVCLRGKIEKLLRHTGVIVLEGHSLSIHEERKVKEEIRSEPRETYEWHSDVYNSINLLRRSKNDPKRNNAICFTTASHIRREIKRIWDGLQERLEKQRNPHERAHESLAATVLDYFQQANTPGLDDRRFVSSILAALVFAEFDDATIRRDTFRAFNNTDPRYVFEHPWDLDTSQTVIFYNSLLVPEHPASDILHSPQPIGLEADGYVRRKIINYRKK